MRDSQLSETSEIWFPFLILLQKFLIFTITKANLKYHILPALKSS